MPAPAISAGMLPRPVQPALPGLLGFTVYKAVKAAGRDGFSWDKLSYERQSKYLRAAAGEVREELHRALEERIRAREELLNWLEAKVRAVRLEKEC